MSLLGVPEKDIEQNFLQSNTNLQPERNDPDSRAFEKFRFSSVYRQPATNKEYQKVAAQFHSMSRALYDAVKLKPEYIQTLLTTIEQRYGTAQWIIFVTQLALD
jgi:Tyrosine phosphatase family